MTQRNRKKGQIDLSVGGQRILPATHLTGIVKGTGKDNIEFPNLVDSVLKRAKQEPIEGRRLRRTGSLPGQQSMLFDGGLFAPTFRGRGEAPRIDEASLREAIRRERKISINYADQDGTRTSRTVWPFGLSFFNNAHVIMAWCELREDFRHFRTDRIHDLSLLEDRYPVRRTKLLRRWEEESRQKNPDLIRQD